MVLIAIIVKHKLHIMDRETVAMINENSYFQYFFGLTSFRTKAVFYPTVFVDIRKCIGQIVLIHGMHLSWKRQPI
jgi:hypothetical protein